MLLDQAEAIEVRAESPEYVAPNSRSPSTSPISALFQQVRGAGPEEGRRPSRARLLLDQDHSSPESSGGGLSFKNPPAPGRMPRAAREDWVCICRLCKLYPGRECSTNWPRRVVTPRKGANKEEEMDEAEKRRIRSASTWTPPRKRSISPQGGTIRCKSPHLCRNAATGRCRLRFSDLNPSRGGEPLII